MLFITNRESSKTRLGNFEFDLNNNAPSNHVYFCDRVGKGHYYDIGSEELLTRLKGSSYRQILIYIHGFSNSPEAAFENAEELQRLCDEQQAEEVLVLPVVWPCDNDFGLVRDYWDDQKSADSSAYSLARVFNKFMSWRDSNPEDNPCLKRINVLAHSMGNRVLKRTLAVWDKYDLAAGVPLLFRSTFLVAADIVNESLELGQEGRLMCHASRNVVVYHAADDLALRASKLSNLKNKVASRRLGHSGPEDMDLVPKNVFAVDCDAVNNKYDLKGHSYFTSDKEGNAGTVFLHIFRTMKCGRVFPGEEYRVTSILQ